MEVLNRGIDFEVWGDPRAAAWTPQQVAFDVGHHGTRAGAVMNELTRRSGLVLKRCREESRRCDVILGDPMTGRDEVRLTLMVAGNEELESDIEGAIEFALWKHQSLWPKPDRHPGTRAYGTLARQVADDMRRAGIRFVKKPPDRLHSV